MQAQTNTAPGTAGVGERAVPDRFSGAGFCLTLADRGGVAEWLIAPVLIYRARTGKPERWKESNSAKPLTQSR